MDKMEHLQEITLPLLEWYRENARELPWRSEATPYRVWVSEIMLQQTRVAAVIGYFNRFMSTLPTVEDLACVTEDELLKLWQGLGYYNRVRNLQKAAKVLAEQYGGVMPADYDAIRALPGIGDYTAGAIASIAFGIPVPAVDGNVLRVIARILGDDQDIGLQSTKDAVREMLLTVIPREFPGQFNQALMELGATVCLPNGAPLCGQCPVREKCAACREGRTGELPVKGAKKARKLEERRVYLVFHRGKVALRKRSDKGLLAGLWEFPNELAGTDAPMYQGEEVCKGKHIFTHIEWHMTAIALQTDSDTLPPGWVWAGKQELVQKYAVPNAFRFVERAVEERAVEERLEKWELKL